MNRAVFINNKKPEFCEKLAALINYSTAPVMDIFRSDGKINNQCKCIYQFHNAVMFRPIIRPEINIVLFYLTSLHMYQAVVAVCA